MKFSTALLFLPSLAAGESLRAGPSFKDVYQSACNSALDENSCYQTTDEDSGQACEWCVAGAVPSECLSPEQANMVPKGVFECKTPSMPRFEFEGKFYELDEADVTGDICDPSSKSLSGYLDVTGSEYDKDGEDKHLFYWMFEKRGASELSDEEKGQIPFVVWLTGGPGCSSTLALLTENGPCSVNDDGEGTSPNPYSWTEAAHVLWLDQPAGVGFSYGSENDSSEEMISEDAYYSLQAFFQAHPEYASSPLYIIGESYGGHYAPSIAHRIWRGNSEAKTGTITLNLAGLGVGNGLTKPEEQYQWYPEMVWNNSHGIKVVDEDTYNAMQAVVPKCTALIKKCNEGDSAFDSFACQTAFLVCNAGLTSPYQMTGLNPYDIREKCAHPPLCYDFSYVEKWLNKESTKQALNVNEDRVHSWTSCNFGINAKFHVDWMKDFSPFVVDLLENGIPTLIYAGDVDFICNYLGNKAWTVGLNWSGGDDFRAADDHSWDDKGLARSSGGLTFLQVYDAGHMVPADKPEVSLDMLKNFLDGGAF